MNELISIIIPVYNTASTLEKCMESVLNQTYRNIEVILVESASTDNSAQLCDYYAELDSRVKVIHQKEKKGLSNARNTGKKIAKGAYIGFVDSDDWITNDMYEVLLYCLQKENADISCGKVLRTIDENEMDYSGAKYEYKVYNKDDYAKKYFRIGTNETVHYAWNKLYTKRISDSIIYPEGMIAEDVEGFYYALHHSHKIVDVDRIIYYYRYNPEGLSSEWFSKKQLDIINVWEHVWNRCKGEEPKWEYYARINYYRSFFGVLTRMLLSGKSNEYQEEKKELIKKTREYYWFLVKSPIPVSRKALMTGMCVNYSLIEKIYWKMGKNRNSLPRNT